MHLAGERGVDELHLARHSAGVFHGEPRVLRGLQPLAQTPGAGEIELDGLGNGDLDAARARERLRLELGVDRR